VALEESVSALICLGYPLCGGGDPTKLRDKVLLELQTPVLFVQGTRDKLCPFDILAAVRNKMTGPNELSVVEGGDHSLVVAKRQLHASGEKQEDVDIRILATIESYVQRHCA
jgi:hypothetical protein